MASRLNLAFVHSTSGQSLNVGCLQGEGVTLGKEDPFSQRQFLRETLSCEPQLLGNEISGPKWVL